MVWQRGVNLRFLIPNPYKILPTSMITVIPVQITLVHATINSVNYVLPTKITIHLHPQTQEEHFIPKRM